MERHTPHHNRPGTLRPRLRHVIPLATGIALIVLVILGMKEPAYAGCTGDCIACHADIPPSPEHASLATCIECHNPEEKVPSLLMPIDEGGCGGNCFQCHDSWPQTSPHATLETCQTCHKN